jgi:hypothetical protein
VPTSFEVAVVSSSAGQIYSVVLKEYTVAPAGSAFIDTSHVPLRVIAGAPPKRAEVVARPLPWPSMSASYSRGMPSSTPRKNLASEWLSYSWDNFHSLRTEMQHSKMVLQNKHARHQRHTFDLELITRGFVKIRAWRHAHRHGVFLRRRGGKL